MNFDIEYIEKLSKILKDNELTEISLENEDSAITIRKDVVVAQQAVAAAPVVSPTVSAPSVQAEASAKSEVKK